MQLAYIEILWRDKEVTGVYKSVIFTPILKNQSEHPRAFSQGNNHQQLRDIIYAICQGLHNSLSQRLRWLPFATIFPLLFINGQVYSLINISCLTRGI